MGIFDRFKSSTVAKLEGLTATDWIAKGQVLDRSDRYAEAIECYDKALEIDPRSGAWWWKGKTLYKLGRFQEALQCYDKSLEIHQNPEAETHKQCVIEEAQKPLSNDVSAI